MCGDFTLEVSLHCHATMYMDIRLALDSHKKQLENFLEYNSTVYIKVILSQSGSSSVTGIIPEQLTLGLP